MEVVTNRVVVLNPKNNKDIKLRSYEGGNLVYIYLMTRAMRRSLGMDLMYTW